MPVPKGYKHRKLGSAKSCAPGSFRRVRSGKALVTICCPQGHWNKRSKRCNVVTRAIGLDKPRGFGSIDPQWRIRKRPIGGWWVEFLPPGRKRWITAAANLRTEADAKWEVDQHKDRLRQAGIFPRR